MSEYWVWVGSDRHLHPHDGMEIRLTHLWHPGSHLWLNWVTFPAVMVWTVLLFCLLNIQMKATELLSRHPHLQKILTHRWESSIRYKSVTSWCKWRVNICGRRRLLLLKCPHVASKSVWAKTEPWHGSQSGQSSSHVSERLCFAARSEASTYFILFQL